MSKPSDHIAKALPRDPQHLLRMGLLLGHAITTLVFDRPLSERDVTEPLPCSPCLTPKGAPK